MAPLKGPSTSAADDLAGARACVPLLLALLPAALLVRLFFVFVGPFFIRPDEVFQVLEPAHRLLTGRGVITWEWHEGIRSWLLPGVVAAVMQASAWSGLGHSVLVVQCAFAVLSLAVVAVAVWFGRVFAGASGALFCGMLTAFWPDTVLDASHTLSEAQGGNLLAIGTMLAAIALRRRELPPRAGIGIGLLLGLAATVRFQLLPGVGVVAAAVWVAGGRRRWGAWLLLGAALPVLGGAVLDAVTLGTPLQSMWKNVAVNVGEHRAALFGTQSALFYPSQMVQFWGAALLPVAACFVAGFRRAMLAGSVVLAVVVSHSLIAHKEFTFIAGAVPLILVVAGVGAGLLAEQVGPAVPAARSWVALGIVAMSLATIFSGYKALRRDHANLPVLMREARRLPRLCGVALFVGEQQWWDWSGGYSLLDRDVPLYLLRRPGDLQRTALGFDALLADEATLAYLPPGFVLSRCLHGICLLHRPGACAPVGLHLMQDELGLGLPVRPGSLV